MYISKSSIVLLISFFCLTAKGNLCTALREFQPRDTFFIKKIINNDKYHIVYIDSTDNPVILRRITGFNEQDSSNIASFEKLVNERNLNLRKFDVGLLSSEWMPVKMLNKKYYLYSPSDKGSKSHRVISDSIFLFETMEGYFPAAISSMRKRDSNRYSFTFEDYLDLGESLPDEVNLYIIDRQKMLAVWEYKSKGDKNYKYELMVPMTHSNDFSIIVNDSEEKQLEVLFEEIDFRNLIKKFK